MRIAIDAMGGDHAPEEIVKGAVLAAAEDESLELTLVGDQSKIEKHLGEIRPANIRIIHTEEYITADDEPVRAIRRKKQSSLVLTAQEVKEGRADACISAGNTGALMTAGLMIVGRIKGIERPALAPTLPTMDGKGFVLLDAGSNIDAKASHLLQYGVMGSIYAEKVRGIENPRVALLNVGTEAGKGNELTKKTFELLSKAPINFVGNVEGRDFLSGDYDVVVTDGFSGNIALKTTEGAAMMFFSIIKKAFLKNMKTKLAAGMMKPELKELKASMEYAEYGGAALFGLAAPVVKAHGSSNARAIQVAIQQTKQMAENNVTKVIQETIQGMNTDEEEA
ncbi:phosphate acyltransferase PlsX [Terribacillus saccharophilus]|uniref:phosphate acyltransferase PlsX n=1 Tax=Terribacillus saccharophilus TaxID=361277 RepID=UPI0039827A17